MKLLNVAIIALAVALGGCRPAQTTSSGLKHLDANPINNGAAWNWSQDSEDEYFHMVAKFAGQSFDRGDYEPADSIARTVIDQWLARFHRSLVEGFPAAMANVPLPQVQIQRTPEVNAFVGALPECLANVRVVFGGSEPTLPRVVLYGGQIMADENSMGPAFACRRREATRQEVEERMAAHFTGADCHVGVNENQGEIMVTPSQECPIAPALREAAGSEELVVLTTSHWITVYSGLIKSFSEPQLVAVLAHELGHYYRSHINFERQYNYAYPLTLDRAPDRPGTSDPHSIDTGEREIAAVSAGVAGWERSLRQEYTEYATRKFLGSGGIFAPIPGQAFHSALIPALNRATSLGWAFSMGSSGRNPDCQAALESRNQVMLLNSERRLFSPPDAATQRLYLDFESAAIRCFAAVRIVPGSNFDPTLPIGKRYVDREISYLTASHYLDLDIHASDMLSYLQNLSAQLDRVYPTYSAARVAEHYAQEEAIGALQRVRINKQAMARSLTNLINEKRIGLYSYEQEADEIAGEFLAMLGVNPASSIDVQRAFMAMSFSAVTRPEACEDMYRRGWTNRGEPDLPPIGSLEFHHQACFRLFNIDRDLAAHRYGDRFTFDACFTPADQWQQLQDGLATSQPAVGGPGSRNEDNGEENNRWRALGQLPCRFAPGAF